MSSKFSTFLELEENARRRKRRRIHGIVMTSAPNGKWCVRWCSTGQMEHMSSGVLRREADPTDDSMVVVNHAMSANREMRNETLGGHSPSTYGESSEVTFGPEMPEPISPPAVNIPMPPLPTPVTETALVVYNNHPETIETDPDIEHEEDERAPLGSGFIYDDATLTELMNDVLGARRDEMNRQKNNLIGNTTVVAGQQWTVRGDILPRDIGIEDDEIEEDDFLEIGLRGLVQFDSLPKRSRSNVEVKAGNRASPRHTPLPKVAIDEGKRIHNFFLTLFPVPWKPSLLDLNKEIEKANANRRRKNGMMKRVTESEYWIFNGILILCGLTKTGGVDGLYKKKNDGIIERVNVAEHMSQRRFKQIKTLWITQFHSPADKVNTEWWMVSKLVNGFNDNRRKKVAASRVKTLDESMSSFRPQKSKTGNLPNISFILRKPKNLGTELKTVASKGANGPMLHAEIQEDKMGMKNKLHFNTYGATSSCVLRLAKATKNCGQKPDMNINNLFYGDSWFASLKTAAAVSDLLNSEFFGVIKNAHRHFPKVYIETLMKDWPSGTHVVLETTKNQKKYYAIGYKYTSKKVICFISSAKAGHTLPGVPYEAKWVDVNNKVTIREIPRPHIISQFFTHSNQIDKHNHARQDLLGIEDNVITECGYFRLYCTYLGMTVTDSWKLYRHHLGNKHGNKTISIMDFSNILCKTLLLNDYKGTAYESRSIPTLPCLDDPASRQSLTFPTELTTRSQASTISSLASEERQQNHMKIGPGKFIPATFEAIHEGAVTMEQGDYVKAGQGSIHSERRKKRSRCSHNDCNKSTKYQCNVCLKWYCELDGTHERQCFQEHVCEQVQEERIQFWRSLQSKN